jgi:hypothetical protein
MRPWGVWWDFRWNESVHDNRIKWVVIQTDHPDYLHVDYIHCLPVELCEDKSGHIDTWISNWFEPFREELESGKVSIHVLMKKLGYEKKKR